MNELNWVLLAALVGLHAWPGETTEPNKERTTWVNVRCDDDIMGVTVSLEPDSYAVAKRMESLRDLPSVERGE